MTIVEILDWNAKHLFWTFLNEVLEKNDLKQLWKNICI